VLIADLQAHREQLLLAHVEAENNNDVDAVIATFAHPRYELVPTAEIFDGDEEVRRYYREKEARGQRRYEIVRLYHSADAVIVEIRTLSLEPAPPYRVDLPSIGVFEFEGPRLMCERVYYDLASFMRVAGD
jgi:limonene-1,2-epoxide hydrolase